MAWLTGYQYRKRLPITGTTPDQQSFTYTVQPSGKDSRIVESQATTNFGSEESFVTRHLAGSEQRALLEFDVSDFDPPSGYSISSAKLKCYYYDVPYDDPAGETIWAYKLTRTDWVESQVTWNIYKTGSDWTTPGGDYVTSDPVGASTTVPGSSGQWMEWDIKDIVEDAIANCSSIVEVILVQTTGESLEIPAFRSKNYGTATYRPKLEINWTYTPSVPDNYKIYLDIFRGSPTVEDGTWTVNGKTYNHRVAFKITTNDALPSGYPVKVVIDTKKLVDAGTDKYFAGSTAGYAKTVEFADAGGNNDMKYWVQSHLGNPKDFNTDHTVYWIAVPALAAETEYTYYLYVDKDQTSASSNHDPSSVWDFFEDFATTAANTSAFLSAYTDWERDPTGNDPDVSVAEGSSVLHLSSSHNYQWDGIATKTSVFTITDFRALFRYTETPEQWGVCGMFDAAGPSGSEKSAILSKGPDNEITRYKDNNQTHYDFNYHSAPFIVEFTKKGSYYLAVIYNDDADGRPDMWGKRNLAANDEAHKPYIGSYFTNAIDVDYVAVGPKVQNDPIVEFPNILYKTNATVFCDDCCQHWPYDVAFTDDDGETGLYYWPDPLTELTKQPGYSMQVAVKVTDNLGSDQNIYCYYGNSSVTSPHAHCSGGNTFNTFDAFANANAWATSGGNWSTPDVEEPVLRRGDVGNVGGGGGRLWARMPIVVKKAANDYRMIFTNTLWERSAGGWPSPFRIYGAKGTALDEEFGPGQRLITDHDREGFITGYWPEGIEKDGDTWYVSYTIGGGGHPDVGMGVAYSTDLENWTIHSNTPFITASWVNDQGNWPDTITEIRSYKILKVGSRWHCFYSGVVYNGESGGGDCGVAHNDNDPENWTLANWVDDGPLITPGAYLIEDMDVVYDESRYWYAFFTTAYDIRYYTLDTQTQTFPTGTWVYQGLIGLTRNAWARGRYGSARLIKEGDDWYLFHFGQGVPEDAANALFSRWVPNYIGVAKCSTLDGNWTYQHTDKKYHQSSEAGYPLAYVTASDYRDVEIIADVMVKYSTGNQRMAGILFRYDSTNDNGYWAAFDYNSGDPVVRLYKRTGGSSNELASAVTIEKYPLPAFHPGYEWRLRVQTYGDEIKVAYSPWGNEWIEAFDVEDGSYLNGKVGVITGAAGAYFDNFRVRDFVLPEPEVGEVEEAYIQPDAIASAEAFGTAQVLQLIAPSAIPPAESLGVPVIAGPIIASSIPSTETFGGTSLTLYILPSAIAPAEASGTPKLNLHLAPSSIAPAEAFGTPSVVGLWLILPTGIPSTEALGMPIVQTPLLVISPSGIPSAQTLGSPTIVGLWVISPSAIPSGEILGSPTLIYTQFLIPTSIPSGESLGTAFVKYAAAHLILEARYAEHSRPVNRAQVFGDDVFTEDWDWDELALVFDQLAQVYDLNLDSVAKAHARGEAMLRDAEVHAEAGYIIVPMNCGQELYDVVQITDPRAGLSGAKRRVLALQHTYHPEKGTYVLKLTTGAV